MNVLRAIERQSMRDDAANVRRCGSTISVSSFRSASGATRSARINLFNFYTSRCMRTSERCFRSRGHDRQAVSTVQRAHDLEIDLITGTATRGQHAFALGHGEFDSLEHFAQKSGQILIRTMIFYPGWGADFNRRSNSREVCLGLLRKKVDLPGSHSLLRTVRFESGHMLG